MMSKESINVSKIETYLNSILDNTVSSNTFFGNAPEDAIVKSSNWQDMCVVNIPNGVRDYDAYGKGTVLVWLYAKPMESGRKNVAKMSQLEGKLNAVIDNANSGSYYIKKRLTYTTFDTTINWHCNVVELQILIV